MRQEVVSVVGCERLTPALYLLRLAAPWLAASARPGQFVHVRCGNSYDPLLRRPLSVHRVGRENAQPSGVGIGAGEQTSPTGAHSPVSGRRGEGAETIAVVGSDAGGWGLPRPGEVALLFRLVGRGTAWLAERKAGDVVDVLGPLGRGFAVAPTSRRLLLVAGGVGVAPLVMLAEEALARGLAVALAAGAHTAAELFPGQLLPPEVEYLVATEDGSLGRQGLVTDLLPGALEWADQVFACGPLPMLAALRRLRRRPGATPIQASLEEHMGCALGVCYGCVVETRQGLRRVCHDGPVFNLDDLL